VTPGAWIIVGWVGASALAGLGYMVWRYFHRMPKWRDLGFRGIGYAFEPGAVEIPPVQLQAALNVAFGYLLLKTRWPSVQLNDALEDFKLYIYASDEYAGTLHVAGYENEGIIGVNHRLTTLVHELGHLCQERIDNFVDYDHVRFEADGILKAETAYASWLKEGA
jgi:hypothetical protein